ncbi:hypothetical protein AC249_AIPGENE8726 [Exaiptasia diaphana]|nr:hypothetical protein AC249_AIPGENE8726 [Exaiptasia diaphana]
MTSFVEKEIPCEADLLRSAHDNAMEKCLKMFHDETFSFSTKSVDKYLKKLTDKTNFTFSSWLEKNNIETETFCTQLIKELKRTILDPVLARLRSQEGSKMQFGDIELQKEMEQNIEVLQQMKDYDESLAKEKAAKAALEERRQKIEEEKARFEEEMKNKEREMEVLRQKQQEEKARLQELFEKNLKDQREQVANMMEANFEEQRKDREAALARQKTIEDMFDMMKSSLESRDRKIQLEREQMDNLIATLQRPKSPDNGCLIL